MKRNLIRKISFVIILVFMFFNFVYAEELKMQLGETLSVKHDAGFSQDKAKAIGRKDVHYGWDLGHFYISGYSNNDRISEEGTPVFLKNLNDKITLSFVLEQDINALNNNENLTINEDINGQDEYFGTEKINMGRGMLLIRHTDYQNVQHEVVKYENYLEGKVRGANTEVHPLEEGDYEVALDYEIKNTPRKIFGHEIIPEYHDYRTFFKFKVRNGNCMVFPIDVKTNGELANSMMTENGFKLDLAKSRYLGINIKREILRDGENGLTEDTRFNRTARDGEEYTEEGIYTITAKNPYTNQETTKKIYVGKDTILKAYMTTGKSIEEIRNEFEQAQKQAEEQNQQNSTYLLEGYESEELDAGTITVLVGFGLGIIFVIAIVIKIFKFIFKKKKKDEKDKKSNKDNKHEQKVEKEKEDKDAENKEEDMSEEKNDEKGEKE